MLGIKLGRDLLTKCEIIHWDSTHLDEVNGGFAGVRLSHLSPRCALLMEAWQGAAVLERCYFAAYSVHMGVGGGGGEYFRPGVSRQEISAKT